MADDDLEDVYELTLRGRKADLVEIAMVLHRGHHVKHQAGEYTPPDYRMVNWLLEDLHEQLDPEAATQALHDRLGTDSGPIVGEPVSTELREVETGD